MLTTFFCMKPKAINLLVVLRHSEHSPCSSCYWLNNNHICIAIQQYIVNILHAIGNMPICCIVTALISECNLSAINKFALVYVIVRVMEFSASITDAWALRMISITNVCTTYGRTYASSTMFQYSGAETKSLWMTNTTKLTVAIT